MDKFSDRFSYDKTSNRDRAEDVSPFRVVFDKRAILQTLVITAFTLLLLTAVALVWPWDDLPHRRPFDIVLKLIISGLTAAVAEEIFQGLDAAGIEEEIFSGSFNSGCKPCIRAPAPYRCALSHFASYLLPRPYNGVAAREIWKYPALNNFSFSGKRLGDLVFPLTLLKL
jgi:hypothetical protein